MASSAFVLDNSLLCGWFLANQATDDGDAVARQLEQNDAHAPWLLQLEFTNVLRFNLTSYDAAYLELALRLQLPIATRDGDLAEAAWAAGVGILSA